MSRREAACSLLSMLYFAPAEVPHILLPQHDFECRPRLNLLSSARALPWVVLTLLFLISLPGRHDSPLRVRRDRVLRLSAVGIFRSRSVTSTMSTGISTTGTSRARISSKRPSSTSRRRPGYKRNFAPIGSALLWAPFYAIGDAGVRIARLFGSSVAADGFSRPYISAITYGSAVYGFLALVLSAIAARRIVGVTAGALAAVCFGTPLVFYMYVAPGFSHANSAFAVAAFVVVWLHVRRDWSAGGVAALGALAALMGMVREQDLFIAIGPAIDYVVTDGSRRARREPVARRDAVEGCARSRARSPSVFCRRRSRTSRCKAISVRRRSFSRR